QPSSRAKVEGSRCEIFKVSLRDPSTSLGMTRIRDRRPVFHYRNPNARKSSRGSSKLQLPKEVTNFRRSCSLLMSIFHSRHAKNSSVKENASALELSSATNAMVCSALSGGASQNADNVPRMDRASFSNCESTS